jgi:hypothetical protein
VAVELSPLLRLLLVRLIDEDLCDTSHRLTEQMVLDVITPSTRELVLQMPTSPLIMPIVEVIRENPADQTTLSAWARRLGGEHQDGHPDFRGGDRAGVQPVGRDGAGAVRGGVARPRPERGGGGAVCGLLFGELVHPRRSAGSRG